MPRRVGGIRAGCAESVRRPRLGPADSGWWASEDAGVQAAWAAGINGKGVTIAMIDEPVISDAPELEGADISYALAPGTDCHYTDGSSMTATIKAGTPLALLGEGESPVETYATHGTYMLANIVGNGKGYDGGVGVRGVAPGTSVDFYANMLNNFSNEGLTSCPSKDQAPQAMKIGPQIDQAVDKGARLVSMSFLSQISEDDYDGFLSALRHGVILGLAAKMCVRNRP